MDEPTVITSWRRKSVPALPLRLLSVCPRTTSVQHEKGVSRHVDAGLDGAHAGRCTCPHRSQVHAA